MCLQAEKLCKLGATDKEVADFFEISEVTLNAWKKKYPKFFKSLKAGKDQADAEVASKLYHRAIGYEHKADKIFQYEGAPVIVPYIERYPPDPTSCIFWLKNRQKEKWRDTHVSEVTGKDGGPIETKDVTDLELARRVAFLLNSADHQINDEVRH